MSAAADPSSVDNSVQDRYIVVFDEAATRGDVEAGRDAAVRDGGVIHFEYDRTLKGFAATLPQKAVDRLQRNPRVLYLEPDQLISVADTQSPVTWGLDRIDQRTLPLSNSYSYDAVGSAVHAYVIDTGIRASHEEFGGRASEGYDAVGDGRGSDDCNGHGTHVAGTIGGGTYGVAKGVNLIAVRVLDCSGTGTISGVIAGVEWVTVNAVKPAVANLSLGGPASSTLDNAVAGSIASGVTYAVAAGNDNQDACNNSPARTGEAITVGSTTATDERSAFSNYGDCLDLFAPGSGITSAWYTGDSATNTISGTSMAAPHVAGAAALYLQSHPIASPSDVRDVIVSTASGDVVTSAGAESPNRLLYAPQPDGDALPPLEDCSMWLEQHTAKLSGSGDYEYEPNSAGYTTENSGTHRGCLAGPSGADFDLYLYKRSGSRWIQIADSQGGGSAELVSHTGTPGTYRWTVRSYRGSGTYTLGVQRP